MARFTAVTPQLRLGASLTAAPISTASVVGQMARFTASLYGAVGASSSTFAFFADGYMIADCAAVSTTSTVNNDLSVRVATCETTGLAVGTRAITATYGGDIYNFPANADASASPNQTQSHVVTAADVTPPIGLTAQTISVAAITAKQFGASPFGVTATATSGLTVVLASTTPSVCTVSGATVAVAATSSAAATCTLTANQAGNATFAPAAQVSVSFSVMPAALTAQTITVAAIAATQFGAAPFAATTSATSGLIVVLASTTPNVCTVSGNTVIVAVAGTVSATCTLAANQVGNATFAPAAQVSVSFSVTATPILSDTTPDAFTFVSVTNQVIALPEIRSNAVTITGVDAAASISVSGGEYSIGCTASFTAATATINNNQTVCVRHAGAVAEGATVTTSLNVGGVTGAFSSTTAVVLAGGKRFPLYRLYSPNQARHFYTTNEAERMQLIADGWQPEGIVAQLLETPGTMGGVVTQPLFRLFHAPSNYHFWTSDANENAVLATRGWVQQGTVGYLGAAPNPLGIKFIRLIRGNAVRHVFTTDQNEARFLVDVAKYIDEGVVGYALK